MLLKVGDVITLREESRKSARIKELIENNFASATSPKWLEVDRENVRATVKELPKEMTLTSRSRSTLSSSFTRNKISRPFARDTSFFRCECISRFV